MKSVIIEKEDCKREMQIEVPVEDWTAESEKTAKEFTKVARVPGFRPGHVPLSVVKQRFRQEIRAEVLKTLLPKVIEDATKENNISMLTQPDVRDLVFEDGKPLTFNTDFEVLPTLEVPETEYKGLKAEEEPISITDEEVEATLQNMREQGAEFLVVEDRPIQAGDYVTIGFTAYPTRRSDDKPEKSFAAKDLVIEVGGERTVKEFTENLPGKKTGEEVQFSVDYGDDFADKRLAGRHVAYHLQIEAVKTKSLPAIDDDFAKTLGEFDTLAEMKDKIRKDMEENKRHQVKDKTCDTLMSQILEKNPFPAPNALVEAQIDSRMQGMIRSLYQQGVNPKQLSIDWEKLREEHRQTAVRDVKASLLLEHIAKQENVSASDEEVDAEIARLAERSQESFSTVKQHLTKEGALDKLRSQLTNQKILNFLYENADISAGATQLDKQKSSS